jgi:DNA helicase HerA-like ATPase
MQAVWALRVLSFSSEDAAVRRSLDGQLILLRTLAEQPAGVKLTWRLEVDLAEKSREVGAQLTLLCDAEEGSLSPTRASELASLASVVLASSHSLSLSRTPSPARLPRSRRILIPRAGAIPPVKSDWAVLVDLLRHRGERIVVDVECRSTQSGQGRPATAPSKAMHLPSDAGAAYLAALSDDGEGPFVDLRVAVFTPGKADELLLGTIAQLVLGVQASPVSSGKRVREGLQVTPEVALRAWHSPYAKLQGRGLTPSPPNVPAGRDLSLVDGVTLGQTKVQGPDWDRSVPLRLSDQERLRHVYIVGKTGVGKTNLLKQIAQQDIERGAGVAVLSPHADLIDHLLASAGQREQEVTYLDFGHPTHLPVLNPLTLDVEGDADFSANSARIVELFTKRTFNQFTGPVFTDSVRLAIESIQALAPVAGEYPTLVAAVELIRSDKLQRWASRQLKQSRPDLAEEWERIFNMRGSEAAETARWVTSKFSDLAQHSALRAITSNLDGDPFSLREIYRQGRILLVKLPETRMPSISSSLLGRLLFSSLYREAQLLGPDESRPFFVHVDEFQRFVSGDLEELVAEARKFKLGLTFAHQNLRQLESFSTFEGTANPRLAEAIFSNVGTIVAMKTSGRDVQPLAQELAVPESTVRGLVRGQAIVRTTHESEDVVCTVRIPLADTPPGSRSGAAISRRMLEKGVWRPVEEQHRRIEAMLSTLRLEAATRPAQVGAEKASEGSFLDDWLAKRKQVGDAQSDSSVLEETKRRASTKKRKEVPVDKRSDAT